MAPRTAGIPTKRKSRIFVLSLQGFVAGFAGLALPHAFSSMTSSLLGFSSQTLPTELHQAGW